MKSFKVIRGGGGRWGERYAVQGRNQLLVMARADRRGGGLIFYFSSIHHWGKNLHNKQSFKQISM